MATVSSPLDADKRVVLESWIDRLTHLVRDVEQWSKDADWPTRVVSKTLHDPELGGKYSAPALLIQRETTRLMMEPVARQAPGADGVVDFYLMPGYDDIATLFHYAGRWHVHYPFRSGGAAAGIGEGVAKPFDQQAFRELVAQMAGDA